MIINYLYLSCLKVDDGNILTSELLFFPWQMLHRLLQNPAIEQEATEVLRSHPFSVTVMVGFGEVVNHKICHLKTGLHLLLISYGSLLTQL